MQCLYRTFTLTFTSTCSVPRTSFHSLKILWNSLYLNPRASVVRLVIFSMMAPLTTSGCGILNISDKMETSSSSVLQLVLEELKDNLSSVQSEIVTCMANLSLQHDRVCDTVNILESVSAIMKALNMNEENHISERPYNSQERTGVKNDGCKTIDDTMTSIKKIKNEVVLDISLSTNVGNFLDSDI